MTDAEQVACDALRMAGLGELADNLAFAREAVRLRADLVEMLECDTEGYCGACGVHAESESHRLSCRLVPLFATREGWAVEEVERAHGEALRQERMRSTPSPLGEWAQREGTLFNIDPSAELARWLPVTTLEDLRRNVPGIVGRADAHFRRTAQGRLAMAQSLVQHLSVVRGPTSEEAEWWPPVEPPK